MFRLSQPLYARNLIGNKCNNISKYLTKNINNNHQSNILRNVTQFNFSSTYKEYTQPFRILDGSVKKDTDTFKNNQENMNQLIDHLNQTLNKIRIGGSQNAIKKHTGKGKLMVRDRISKILDPGSPFLELSPLAAYGNVELNEETGC